MAITKAKKGDIIAKIEAALTGATSAVFVRFHKLTVANATEMRKALKQEGVGYYVAKKTLISRALSSQKYGGSEPDLVGEVALAWGKEDVTTPARLVHEFGKKFKGAVEILGGVFEGAFADAVKMNALATIPSVPVLRGMFANIINSPVQRFAVALNEVAKTKN